MAVKKIQEDWQIQPTTATENAETQANMAAALAETQGQTEATEATQEQDKPSASANVYDVLANVWGGTLSRRNAEIEKAAEKMTAIEAERKAAEEAMTKARANESSFLKALLEEQKPVRKEDEEKKLRNRAVIKGLGDLVGAIATGVHAYGKRGAGVVPTLASSSPLKDIEKLNALQEEYLKRKEAWKALDLKIRMGEIDAENANAKEAYQTALERMKAAQTAYDNAVKGYEDTHADYNAEVAKVAAEERRQDRQDARERYVQGNLNYRASLDGKGKDKEVTDVEILDELFPWKPKVNKTARYDANGNLEGYSESRSTYSKAEREAEARGNEYVRAVKDLMNDGLSKEEAVALVKVVMDEDMRQASESLHNVARGGKK